MKHIIRIIVTLLMLTVLSAASNAKADGALDTPTIACHHHCPK